MGLRARKVRNNVEGDCVNVGHHVTFYGSILVQNYNLFLQNSNCKVGISNFCLGIFNSKLGISNFKVDISNFKVDFFHLKVGIFNLNPGNFNFDFCWTLLPCVFHFQTNVFLLRDHYQRHVYKGSIKTLTLIFIVS